MRITDIVGSSHYNDHLFGHRRLGTSQDVMSKPMLVGEIVSQAAVRVPERIALIQGERRLSYQEFEHSVNRVANALTGLKFVLGSKIALLSTSKLEYPLIYFGAARAGVTSVHLSTRTTVDDVAFMLSKVRAEALFFEPRFSEIVATATTRVPSLRHLISLNGSDLETNRPSGCITLDEFLSGASDQPPGIDIDPDAPLAITFTGGTTGFPKGVVVSHTARLAAVQSAAADFGLNEHDIVIASTPLFHAAGLYVWFSTAIMLGATVVLQRVWDPVDFMTQVERHGVTAAFLVPTQISDLISHPEFSAERVSSLQKLGYAGAPMGSALLARVQAAFPTIELTENYGQSETCPITIRCASHPREKLGTVGRAARGIELRVVDRNGESMATGAIGEIVVRADHNFTEYFEDPEQTAEAFRRNDGWLWTGDLGYLDKDGFLTLVERSKDMLVSGGENIYPAEIENAIYRHDSVAECAVFGVPDQRLGEVPAAFISLKPGEPLCEDELTEFLAGKIAPHKLPRLIRFVDSLPRTPVGKIRKDVLRAPYWEGRRRKV